MLPLWHQLQYFGDEGKLTYLMATQGKISAFNAGTETWTSYTELLGFYFSANDIEDPGKKRSILLTICRPSTYQLLKSLLQPASPADKTYDELDQTLNNHFSPVPSPIVQRLNLIREFASLVKLLQFTLLNLKLSENTVDLVTN